MLRVPAPETVFEFGEFRFEPGNSRLTRAGEELHAQPKALRVLAVLIENAGTLVDRDALFDLVWRDVAVTPGALTRLIRDLRRLLDDDAGEPRFIETVHTRGYRFVAPVARSGGSSRRTNLPEPTVTLIGRQADLARLEDVLSASRLLTLAGPGGSGKTQLALELGRRLAAASRAVVWVDLSSATDKLHCSRLIAAALDAREREDLSLETTLARVIGAREIVLLLDNCEVVIHPVVSIARTLLAQCVGLKLLCTSQVTLDVADEVVHWVRPLEVPDEAWSRGADPVAELLGFDAVRLLVERARAVTPEFQIDRSNAPAIAAICQQLDGLPLALEIAASRLATLTPQQLLAALGDRFGVLERRAEQPDARFQSLRAAIEWSYALLDPREREVLDAFGVFAGPFSIDAARAVAGNERGSAGALLKSVHSLAQKSLLVVDRGEREIRYRLLDSVKAFARSRLEESGRDAEVQELHAAYFVALARQADGALLGADQIVWVERLYGAWPDLTAVYERLRRQDGAARDARALATGLRWYFWVHGMYGEALQWLRGWRALADSASAAERAALLNGVAIVLLHAFRLRESAQAARDAASAAREANAMWEHSFARSLLRWIAAVDPAAAAPTEAAPDLDTEAAPDPWTRAFALMGPAFTDLLGWARHAALDKFARLRALAESAGDRHLTMYATNQEALLLYLSGRAAESRRSILRSVDLSLQLSNPRAIAGVSECSGYLAIAAGDAALGARFLGSAEAARETTGAPHFPQWLEPHREAVARAQRALGQREFEEERAAGRRMGIRETAGLAVEVHTAALARLSSKPAKRQRS